MSIGTSKARSLATKQPRFERSLLFDPLSARPREKTARLPLVLLTLCKGTRADLRLLTRVPARWAVPRRPNDVARAVLAASTWSVLALTCHIELSVQAHYAESITPGTELCPLFKDVFGFHWKDESRHVVLDELEWKDEHATLSPDAQDEAVNDLIALVAAVDGLLQAQAAAGVQNRRPRTRSTSSAAPPSRSATKRRRESRARRSAPTGGSTSSRACRTGTSASC